MKRILCFLSRNDYMALEAVTDYAQSGDEVLFLGCDKTIGICHENETASCTRCSICKRRMHGKVKEFERRFPNIIVKYTTVKKEVNKSFIENASKTQFEYNKIEDLKAIQYKGVNIGYAALSNFASTTRNIMPNFTDYFHRYIDYMLRQEMIMTDVAEKIMNKTKFDVVIFHNGRFCNIKPVYEIAKNKGIDYVATELFYPEGILGRRTKNNFFNGIPHAVEDRRKKVEIAWRCAGEKGEQIGRNFFESRYHGRPSGDKKIYVKDQTLGMLPEGFDPNITNIAIFNSSEDEFCAISKELDDGMLFKNQYIALKAIFEHYKDKEGIHFYLRIHPNLAKVPYRSHTALYELKYPNVTIIPPKSPISTYTLMENADKVIVFNSTMGVESTYWGKPVIGLSRCVFSSTWNMPSTEDELYKMIDDPNLPVVGSKTDCYKIGCYCLGYYGEEFRNFPTSFYKVNFLGKSIFCFTQFKLLGSSTLSAVLESVLCNFLLKREKFTLRDIKERTC